MPDLSAETPSGTYPYRDVRVNWQRPPVDRELLREFTRRSDTLALLHCLGSLAIPAASGTAAYLLYAAGQWVGLAIALYIHGSLHAFQPQTHEFAHGRVFKTRWLNSFFKRVFGLIFWTGNGALYKLSHMYHHQYTLHRQSEGEEVHPRAETTETLLARAVKVVDLTALLTALYDQVYFLFKPFLRNPRRSTWQRYVFDRATPSERRDVYATHISQLCFHVAFAIFAIVIGQWFLIVIVSLPAFYGGKWYHASVHDTMHVGRQPEVDDFRLCCRTVSVDPLTSFLYWHMEWHTEHHAFAGIPCYRLKAFHRRTREHWLPPQSLADAWREMNRHSEALLGMPPPFPSR